MRHDMQMELGLYDAPAPIYLINDDFTVNQAAPLAGSRVCVPGPGILQIGDTGNSWSLSGGEVINAAASLSTNNPGIWQVAGMTRICGRTLKSRLKQISALGADANKTFSPMVVWDDVAGSGTITDFEGIVYWVANTKFQIVDSISANSWSTIEPCSADTYNVFAVVQRGGGGAFHIVDGKLIGITRQNQDPNVHPNVACLGSSRNPPQIDTFKVADLPNTPWATDYGICTEVLLGARAVNDGIVHEADGHIEFTITAIPSVGNILGFFRQQDANNYWRFNVTSTGTVSIDEVISGTPNARASIGGCQANDRIVISFKGSTITFYRDRPGAGVTNATPYGSALYTTRTTGSINSLGTGGGIKDLATYPYTLSGLALAAINAI